MGTRGARATAGDGTGPAKRPAGHAQAKHIRRDFPSTTQISNICGTQTSFSASGGSGGSRAVRRPVSVDFVIAGSAEGLEVVA
jgi:hypothetical protein